ncbi:uncharacterized protein LOC115768511 [Drosophila novamexicana]|uniref:uncharacterized protein LOC115768511 n=1 Tax=Drosophila novamexicana TaxID=47314 RepID=UPI0011E5CE44|nr:uncharacterized protein LOC115768511 [Drosophila novamexicana]
MELHAGHWLLLLGLCLDRALTWPPLELELEREQAPVVDKLSNVLQAILNASCSAHNLSISVSSVYREQLPPTQRHLVERVLERSRRQAQLLLLFFVLDAQQLIAAAERNPRVSVTHKYKYLIVLLAMRKAKAWQRTQMRQIFGYLLRQRYNVDVLLLRVKLAPGGSTVASYSYAPYASARRCDSTEPLAWPLGQARLEQLYPSNKLANLHGCPLRVIVWQILPYMELHGNGRISGLDADILQLLAARLNFSLALLANEPPQLIGGASYMNGSMTGAFRMLLEQRANLTLGFTACLAARYKYLASTLPYGQVEYVLVLRRARPFSLYEIMLLPFERSVWLLLFVLAAVRPWCRLPAQLQLAWVLFLFLLRISYESCVFVLVHNAPRRSLPHSLEQALQLDYSFIVDHATYRMTELLPALKARSRILPGQPVDMFEQLLAQPPDKRVAAISTPHFLAHYLSGRREQQPLFVLASRKILDNMACVHFPLGSYLTATVDRVLFNMRSSGINQHIANRLTTIVARLHHRRGTASSSSSSISTDHAARYKESMRFIYAALNCLLIAESLTLAIFGLELLSLRLPWLARLFRRL